MNQLNIVNVSIIKGDNCVVEPISMSIDKGEAITILGETGSGKSIFSKAILGDLPAGFSARGKIELNGQSLLELSPHEHQALWGKTLSILPQEPRQSLSPLMRVKQQVAEVSQCVKGLPKKHSEALSDHAFQTLSLNDHANKYPVELSGGMVQRSAFLAATAAGAELLIADEPTKGLDENSKRQVISQLLAHKERGSLITITHDLDVAKALGGNIYVLLKGKWIAKNTNFDALKNDSTDSYITQLFNPRRHSSRANRKPLGKPVIDVQQLGMGFGHQTLFENLSFELCQGEVLGISGASGCGKSTLCDLLLGLKAPMHGVVENKMAFAVGKKLKLYQDPPQSFSANFSLRRQLEDVCKLHNIEVVQIEHYLRRLNLKPDVISRLPAEVSGGELQRIAILRALLLKPDLLIADEPTTRLDPHIAHETMELLMQSVKEIGCALVLVSHNHHELSRYCDKQLYFDGQGHTTLFDTPNQY